VLRMQHFLEREEYNARRDLSITSKPHRS